MCTRKIPWCTFLLLAYQTTLILKELASHAQFPDKLYLQINHFFSWIFLHMMMRVFFPLPINVNMITQFSTQFLQTCIQPHSSWVAVSFNNTTMPICAYQVNLAKICLLVLQFGSVTRQGSHSTWQAWLALLTDPFWQFSCHFHDPKTPSTLLHTCSKLTPLHLRKLKIASSLIRLINILHSVNGKSL